MRCAECGSDLSCADCAICGTSFRGRKTIACTTVSHLCLSCYINVKLTEVMG